LPRGIAGKPSHVGELGAVTEFGELGTLQLGEVGAVTNLGESAVGAVCEIASIATRFSVRIHEISLFVRPHKSVFM
jgi:hypothetical protein